MHRIAKSIKNWLYFWKSSDLEETKGRFRDAIKKHETSVEAVSREADEIKNGILDKVRQNGREMRRLQGKLGEAAAK